MKKLALCLLAYGDEHINECNFLIKNLEKYKDIIEFYVTTDKINNISNIVDNIIKIDEPFNFNLKRISIKEALKKYDIVLFMDTDNYIMNNNINFSFIENIKDGIYVDWVDDKVTYMQEKITIKKLLNKETKSNINNEYLIKLNELNYTNKDLFFIDERIFLIKLTDKNKKENFISHWNNIFYETLYTQPNNGKDGAMEGLIIFLSCIKSDIDVYKNLINFFNNFYHYNKEKNKNNIFNSIEKKNLI